MIALHLYHIVIRVRPYNNKNFKYLIYYPKSTIDVYILDILDILDRQMIILTYSTYNMKSIEYTFH